MALTDSQMAMWETIVALVHVDGKVHAEEDKFIRERFASLAATPEQYQELQKQMEKPGDPKELFKKITKPSDRSQAVHFARILFHRDGDFSAEEKIVLDYLHSEAMSKAEITKAMHEIDKSMIDFKNKEQARRDAQPIHRKIINAIIFWEDLDQ